MILVKVDEPTIRKQLFDMTLNQESLSVDLDLLNELCDKSKIHEAACKLRSARQYNTKVRLRSFQKGDFVWRLRSKARKNDGKFSSNWEGSFRVRKVEAGGRTTLSGYREKLNRGRGIPRTSSFIAVKQTIKLTHSFLT